MANRQTRDPGSLQKFQGRGQISGSVPDFAVAQGDDFAALANVAGSLSARLGRLADQAAQREGALAGLSSGQQSGATYLQARAVEEKATTRYIEGVAKAGGGRGNRNQVQSSGAIRKIISDAATRYGIDPAALMKIAELESSFNPNAKNPNSTAGGLFQFINSTAKDYGLSDRFDAFAAADAAARLARDNAARLKTALGREPTAGELYLAHQQGGGGAVKLLSNAGAKAADVVGADAVRLNGGSLDMTAGQFANLWIRKAGGGKALSGGGSGVAAGGGSAGDGSSGERQAITSVTRSYGLPALSTQPLALRRDGTIRGDAFDASAMRSYAWRVEQGIATDLANAHEEFGDDPAGFAARTEEIRDLYLQDDALADPEMREMFEKNFAARSESYRMDVAARQEKRLRHEEVTATVEGIDAQRQQMERQAYTLGANPEGDRIVADQLGRSGRAIDAAVDAGTLTASQGADAKRDLAETASRARVQGVFDALETPAEKEQFALSLLEDWQTGDGVLAELPFATVKALSQTLFRDARAEANAAGGAARLGKARIKAIVADDLASIEATGKPADLEAAGLDMPTIEAALTPNEFAKWQADRDQAGKLFDAVSGMESQPPDEIAARLEVLAPQPGQPGFADQEEIFEAAQKQASDLLKARAKDPAAAVERAFPEIAEMAANADPADPDSLQALVAARIEGQDALGIPELGRQPLTLPEAASLAQAVSQLVDPGDQARAMQELVGQVQTAYGPHADAVLTQILQVKGFDRDMSAYGAQLFGKMKNGEGPSSSDRRQGQVLDETAAAERAGKPAAAGTTALPNYQAIQLLLTQPELAPQFDEKYGAGAAARILDQRATDPTRRKVDGGTEFVDETGEGYIPDGGPDGG